MPSKDRILDEVLGILTKCGHPRYIEEETFDDVSTRLAYWQYLNNPEYYDYVNYMVHAFGAMPPTIWCTWRDIVPMPVTEFKLADVKSFKDESKFVWSSSGTTGSASHTHLKDESFYRLVIQKEFDSVVPVRKPGALLISLIPDASEWPDSSLAYMFTEAYHLDPTKNVSKVIEGSRDFEIDFELIRYRLSTAGGRQVIFFGTSYAFAKLWDFMHENNLFYSLSQNSYMIDTGGYKGFATPLSRQEMLSKASMYLGFSPSQCFNEYGMSEMSSQLWQRGHDTHAMPSWMRARTIDPMTLKDHPDGVLVLYDLANVWSCMALQTEDLATVTSEGVVIHGRVSDAEAKGCSITASQTLKES